MASGVFLWLISLVGRGDGLSISTGPLAPCWLPDGSGASCVPEHEIQGQRREPHRHIPHSTTHVERLVRASEYRDGAEAGHSPGLQLDRQCRSRAISLNMIFRGGAPRA